MQTIMSIFKDFGGTGYYSILFVLSLIYLAFSEEDKRVKTILVYIPAVMLLLFFLPPFPQLLVLHSPHPSTRQPHVFDLFGFG